MSEYPVELQVLGSGLRAIAEEMGAVLVRSAFSANIKERRDCSTALFDEAGRMVTQAEHIPVHLGAHAGGGRGRPRPRPGARRAVDPQRPVRGRNAPPRPHDRDEDRARLCRLPRAPRGRRRLRAGQPPVRLEDARRGGRRRPADPPRRRRARAARRADAEPGRAPRRPPRAARGPPPRRAPRRGALRAPWPRAGRGGDGRAPRVLGARRARRDRRAAGRAFRRLRRPRDSHGPARDPRSGDDRRRCDRRSTSRARRRSTTGT